MLTKILKKSMDAYWKSNGPGEWHFVHKNSEKTFVQLLTGLKKKDLS